MNKKISIAISMVALLLIVIVAVYFFSLNSKSKNIKFNDNYKYYIEFKVESDVILLFDQNNKVSNILFLNDQAVDTLADKKIEGKDYKKAIELIIDKLKNNNEFNNGEVFKVIKFSENSIYKDIISELNKEFVIYGVDNKIEESTSVLSKNPKELYDESIKLLNKK